MDTNLLITTADQLEEVIAALNSPLRRKMLNLLFQNELNVNEIAEHLSIPQSTCAVNVGILEKAGLIQTRKLPAPKGNQKCCITNFEEILLMLREYKRPDESKALLLEMPLGLFFEHQVYPTCGMASLTNDIGYSDHPDSFELPERVQARILWFGRGFVEYHFTFTRIQKNIKRIRVALELCSEYPSHNNNWASDITMWINGCEIGTWTSPGDMGDVRGKLNPGWWADGRSQYGFFKTWSVSRDGSYIDGVASSKVTLHALGLSETSIVKVRIGNKEDAEHMGGVTIFGRGFGNYDQNIVLYMEHD